MVKLFGIAILPKSCQCAFLKINVAEENKACLLWSHAHHIYDSPLSHLQQSIAAVGIKTTVPIKL